MTGASKGRLHPAWRGLSWFLTLLVFLSCFAFGAVTHLGLPVSRSAAGDLVEQLLNQTLQGTIEIGEIERLAGGGIGARDLRVFDLEEREVLSIERLQADVDPIDILRRMLSDYEKLSIHITRVEIRGSALHLFPVPAIADDSETQVQDETVLSLIQALSPVKDDKSKPKEKTGRPVRIWFSNIRLVDLQAQGSVAGSPQLQTRVEQARAKLLITDKGVLLDLDQFGLRLSGLLGVDTEARGELHLRAPGAVYGKVAGRIGETPLETSFHYENETLEATLKAPRLAPEELRPLVSGWPLTSTIALQAEAKGRLPTLDVQAAVSLVERAIPGDAVVRAEAQVDTTFARPIAGRVITSRLNLQHLIADLPSSSIDSETQVSVQLDGDAPRVDAETRLTRWEVEGQKLPSAEVQAKWAESGWSAEAQFAPEELSMRIQMEKEGKAPLRFSAQLAESALADVALLRPYLSGVSGSASADLQGSLDEEQNLTLAVEILADRLAWADMRVGRAELEFTTRGPVDRPLSWSSESKVIMTGVQAPGAAFDRLDLNQTGTLGHPRLDLRAQGSLGTSLRLTTEADVPKTALLELNASIEGSGKTVDLTARELSYRQGRIILNGFHLESLGSIDADVDFHPSQGGSIRAQARNLSLSRISERAGMPRGDLGGNLDADIDVTIGQQSEGKVEVVVRDGALLGFTGLELRAKSSLEGRGVRGSAQATVGGLGKLEANWDAELAGSPLRETSYRSATGQLSAQLSELDLATLTLLLGLQSTAELGGLASVQFDTNRESGEAPSLAVSVKTQDFSAVLHGEEGNQSTVVRGVDLDGVVSLIPEESNLSAALRMNDRLGLLASSSGEIELPLGQWLSTPPTNAQVEQAILDGPLDLVVLVPERSLSQWPSFVPAVVDSGYTSARIAVSGTLRSPELALVLKGDSLTREGSGLTRPLDLDANIRYVATTSRLSGNVMVAESGQSLASLALNLSLPWRHLVAELPKDTPAWTGQVRTQLDGVPLDLPSATRELGLKGRVEGSLLIDRSGMMPAIVSELRVRGLATNEVIIGDAEFELRSQANVLSALAHLSDEYGDLHVETEVEVQPTPWALELAEGRPVIVELRSDQYNLAAASPFFQDEFRDIAGLMTGRLRAELRPPKTLEDDSSGEPAPWQTLLDGQIRVSSGHLQPTAIGLNMENVSMHIEVNSAFSKADAASANKAAGKLLSLPVNTIRLEKFSAQVESDTPNVHGEGLLRLRNLTPESGEFELSADSVPIYSAASQLLTASGSLRGELQRREEFMLAIQVRELSIELTEAVDDSLISLDENPNIEIVQEAKKRQEKEAEETTPLTVAIDLGNDARVKNSMLDARIAGNPLVRIAEETTVGGSVRVKNGSRFVVLGRTFVVERGLVLFDTGDAADPHLQVSSTWKAPNNVLVRLDVGGTVSAPTLSWSSEPSLPGGEADVLALVIGGGGGGSGSDAGGTSLAIAANELTQVEGLEFYATQTSSQGANQGRLSSLNETTWENYTAAYQISEKLWFEGSVATQNSAGLQTDQTRPGVSGTLDWRFLPNWSLRTEVGTLGVGLDLRWQYRY